MLTEEEEKTSYKSFEILESCLWTNYQNFEKAVLSLNVNELSKALIISQNSDKLLREIQKASQRFKFMQKFCLIPDYKSFLDKLEQKVTEFSKKWKMTNIMTPNTIKFKDHREDIQGKFSL